MTSVANSCEIAETTVPDGAAGHVADTQSFAAAAKRRFSRMPVILFFVLLIAGGFCRLYGLETKPPIYATTDEFHYLWAGLTLMDKGSPESWSFLHAYSQQKALIGSGEYRLGMGFHIVKPALDHPPLFSLVVGAYAKMTGSVLGTVPLQNTTDTYEVYDIALGRARTLTIFLFLFTFVTMYLVGREVMPLPGVFIGLCLYAFSAYTILQNRLLVTENLTTPLILLNVYIAARYVAGRVSERAFAAATIVLIAAVSLCKLVSLSLAPALAVYLLCSGKRREVMWPAAGAVLGVGLNLLYGWWQGWDVFLAVMSSHSARFAGFEYWGAVLTNPLLVNSGASSFLLLVGWFALFHEASTRRVNVFLIPLVYLIAHLFFATTREIYGWHLLTYYPFLFLAIGKVFGWNWTYHDPGRWTASVAFVLPYTMHFLYEKLIGTSELWMLRYSYGLAAGVFLLLPFAPARIRTTGIRISIIIMVGLIISREYYVAQNYR